MSKVGGKAAPRRALWKVLSSGSAFLCRNLAMLQDEGTGNGGPNAHLFKH